MSATEDSITDLMADYLRNQGVNARTQISFKTPGTRDQPDLQVDNGGSFLGEAEWESSKWKGFGEARDYGQVPGVNGSFLIVYPEDLRSEGSKTEVPEDKVENIAENILTGYEYSCAFLRRDEPTDLRTLQLDQIPDWINNNIARKQPPEIDPDEVVSVLRQTARQLNKELQSAPEENLFRNVLGATPDDEDEERQAAKDTAGFLLVNQIAFYRVLSAHREFPDIDPDSLGVPEDLGEYFQLVLDYDYTPVYGFQIVDDLPQDSLPVLKDTIKSIYALSPERINHDILGKVFHELIPVSARRKVAAYYTKNQSAELLSGLSIDQSSDRIMDPACGSGTLLAASYMRKRELSEGFNEDIHRRFVEDDITGIDIMPFAAHLSCIHLALQAPIFETDEVNIGIEDSTKLEPGSSISPLSFVLPDSQQQRALEEFSDNRQPDLDEETVEGGSIAMDAAVGSEMELGKVDVVIMNPPFTRQESVASFSNDYKSRLRDRFSRRDSKGQIHGKMSYFAYFMFLADKFLDEGGRIATVLPATSLNKSTDSGVREMLLEEYDVEYLFAREDELNFSEDTGVREVMLIARKGQKEGSVATYVSLNGMGVTSSTVKSAVENLQGAEFGETVTVHENNKTATIWQMPTSQLDTHNLFSPFAVKNRELIQLWSEIQKSSSKLTKVEDLNPGLTRGGSSHPWTPGCLGGSESYLRSNDLWRVVDSTETNLEVKHRHIGEKITIPIDAVEPYLLRKQYREQVDISDLDEYTVVRDFNGLDRFLQLAEEDEIPDGWEKHVMNNSAHFAIPETAYLTAPGTSHPVLHSKTPRIFHRMWMYTNVDIQTAKLLTLWFDSSFGILQFLLSRLPGRGGWTKYRKYTQNRFKCIDPEKLESTDWDDAEECFESIHEVNAPSLVRQMAMNVTENDLTDDETTRLKDLFEGIEDVLGDGFEDRKMLDRFVLEILGIDDQRIDEILEKLYLDLARELIELRERE